MTRRTPDEDATLLDRAKKFGDHAMASAVAQVADERSGKAMTEDQRGA